MVDPGGQVLGTADFGWPERGIAGEFDGFAKYGRLLRPGEVRSLTLSPKPGVRYLGVAVLFREIDRAQWRAISAIATSGLTRLTLAIDHNKAVLEPA